MKKSIVLAPTTDAWRTVQRAEQLGFDRVWFFDSPSLYTDIFVAMALCAHHTERIELATGVIVPSNRIDPVTANAIASLEALAPGRVILGLGTGFTGRHTMGLGAMKLRDLEHTIDVCRTLWRGEIASWQAEGAERKVKLLHDSGRFGRPDPEGRIFVSGMGPKSMRLTVGKSDGWMAFAPGIDYALQYLHGIDQTCDAMGRERASLPKSILSPGCILADDEPADSARALAQAGPLVAVFFHNLMEGSLDFELPPELQQAADAYRRVYEAYEPADARYLELHRRHLVALREEEVPFIAGELIRAMTFTGTREELSAQLARLEEAGCDDFGVQLMTGSEDELENWAALFGLTEPAAAAGAVAPGPAGT
ncbi:MAG: hypothetical protein JWM31_3236 [Solirubrobacterales bacterium]|nr:hypothetical protein [Solirubrobacterales bacterium]